MGEAETVEISGDALRWLADKFRSDCNEILSDIDHAQFAGRGGVYDTSAARYAVPDDDPHFRRMLWQATGGAAGEPAEDRVDASAQGANLPLDPPTSGDAQTSDSAEAAPERSRRREVPAAAAGGSGWIAPADRAWPGGLDLRELHRALSGVAGCLAGIDSLGSEGSEIDPDYLGPPIETLVAWQKRVRDARDMLEAETAGARERPQ